MGIFPFARRDITKKHFVKQTPSFICLNKTQNNHVYVAAIFKDIAEMVILLEKGACERVEGRGGGGRFICLVL